jgi:SAM-dependent methyltransferase
MANREYLDYLNQNYFDGQLSESQLSILGKLDTDNKEGVEFIEKVFARIKRIGISAKDTPELLIWELATVVPKLLPGTWGGIVPPITFPQRHVLVEEFMRINHYRPLIAGSRVLDMGCGFPPFTAIDLAARYPDVQITGADPSFGKYTVTDKDGNYACILEDGSLKYLQPSSISSSQWSEVFYDLPATVKKFLDIFHELVVHLPEQESPGSHDEYSSGGNTIVRNPLRKYKSHNLDFVQKGIGDEIIPGDFDMIRCMNVLLYFDPAFRDEALKWAVRQLKEGGLFICGLNYAQSINSRITVYQKEGGMMTLREFSFSIENIRPMQMVTYFSFRDDDFEQEKLLKHVAIIREDKAFMSAYNEEADMLQKNYGISLRDANGYLVFFTRDIQMNELLLNMQRTGRELSQKLGQSAVEVLKRHGTRARVNEIGFISVGNP